MKTSTTARIASFAFALLLTTAMLAGINGLAVSDPPDTLLARGTATQPG